METSGSLTLDEIPAYTTSAQLTLSGHAAASAEIRVEESGKQLAKTGAKKDGSFSLKVKLADEGDHELVVTAGEDTATFTIRYEKPDARLEITEPESTTFTGGSVTVRGVTEPNATVYIDGKGMNTNVKAGKNGGFSVRVFMSEAGTETFTLRAKADGFAQSTRSITLTREWTQRELIAQFRQKMIALDYDELAKKPAQYAQKRFILRGKVMEFTDYDGQPCALACVSNPATGVWEDRAVRRAVHGGRGGAGRRLHVLPDWRGHHPPGGRRVYPFRHGAGGTRRDGGVCDEKQMSALKIGNVLRAGLMAWAMFMDLNVRSGDNYVNIGQSLVGMSGAVALAALVCLLALSWADERLPKAGLRVRLAALFLGVWQVIAVSVVNTNDLNQPFLSGSQKLKAAVLALGMASLFELLFRLLEAGLDGRLDLRIQRDGALRRAYRAHTLLFCMAAVLLCWLPHLAVSYPASMNSDTQSQFDQILGLLPWSKHHPTLLAFFLLGTTRLGHALGSGNAGLFAYVLVQAVFAAAVIGYSQWIMRRLCAPVWLRALSLALCALAPGVLRQHHGDPQGCALQLRDAVDALRDGSTAFSGKGRRRVRRGVCAPHDPVRVFDASGCAGTARWSGFRFARRCFWERAAENDGRRLPRLRRFRFCSAQGLTRRSTRAFIRRRRAWARRCPCRFSRRRGLFRNTPRKSPTRSARKSTGCWFTTSWQNAISRSFPTR